MVVTYARQSLLVSIETIALILKRLSVLVSPTCGNGTDCLQKCPVNAEFEFIASAIRLIRALLKTFS